jgi:hypothetical protein
MPITMDYKRDIAVSLQRNRDALNGKYKTQLEKLLHLSKEEREAINPNITNEEYSNLISVVRHASIHNEQLASLYEEIEEMGGNVLELAKVAGIIL